MKITFKKEGRVVATVTSQDNDQFKAQAGSQHILTPHLPKALRWAETQARLQVSS